MEEEKSGLGHQFRFEEKCLTACKQSLEQAFYDLETIPNKNLEVLTIQGMINMLINKTLELSYSAREANKQDN